MATFEIQRLPGAPKQRGVITDGMVRSLNLYRLDQHLSQPAVSALVLGLELEVLYWQASRMALATRLSLLNSLSLVLFPAPFTTR